jgi:hypothetical protein
MNAPESIVCKPTPWFLFRALVMLVMFSIFAAMFYLDGSTGYRKKNEVFYLHRTFEQADKEFARMNADGSLTPEAWQAYAAKQSVNFPEDRTLLPASLELPMPWPAILHDYARMKPLQWNLLWREYSKERGLDAKPKEAPYDARKIKDQWKVCWVCLALAAAVAFVLLRTLRRSIAVDDEAITTQQGRRIPFTDLKLLDLRKWETKGLAFLDYDGTAGKGRIRIDGLTYGGFKQDNDEPAERLMRHIRARFTGEIIEYAPAFPVAPVAAPTDKDMTER